MSIADTPQSETATAIAAWMGTPPDWVLALAAEADRTSLREAGRKIGMSYSSTWEVIRARYRAGTGRVEERVRAALMRGAIACPILGEITAAQCLGHQNAPYRGANPISVRLTGECPRCPNSSRRRDA